VVPRAGLGFGVEKIFLPSGFETQLVKSVAQSPYNVVLHADLRRWNVIGFHKSSKGTVSVSKQHFASRRYGYCQVQLVHLPCGLRCSV